MRLNNRGVELERMNENIFKYFQDWLPSAGVLKNCDDPDYWQMWSHTFWFLLDTQHLRVVLQLGKLFHNRSRGHICSHFQGISMLDLWPCVNSLDKDVSVNWNHNYTFYIFSIDPTYQMVFNKMYLYISYLIINTINSTSGMHISQQNLRNMY